MNFLNKLEREFGDYALENLTYYLLAGQVIAFVLLTVNPEGVNTFNLIGSQVLAGEYWRLISFLFVPFTMQPLFVVFTWYLYYLYGGALEKEWGSFRYTVYLLIMYILTIAAALVLPNQVFSHTYIYTSVFLAFAYLYPNFTLNLFFILPVKIKWLAAIAWAGILLQIVIGSMADKILAVVSVANFLLFFGSELLQKAPLFARQLQNAGSRVGEAVETNMQCTKCGKTEKNSDMIFYYCEQCIPEKCYCEEHIKKHKHIN